MWIRYYWTTVKYAFLYVKCSCGKELHRIKSPSSAPRSSARKALFNFASLNKSAAESQPPFPPDVRNLSPLEINKASEMFWFESPRGRRERRQNELVEEESGTPGSQWQRTQGVLQQGWEPTQLRRVRITKHSPGSARLCSPFCSEYVCYTVRWCFEVYRLEKIKSLPAAAGVTDSQWHLAWGCTRTQSAGSPAP